MQPPSDELRADIAGIAANLRDLPADQAEIGLSELIDNIASALDAEIEQRPPDLNNEGEELLAACDAWASLVSHAVIEVYAPNSPFRFNVAGWGSQAITKIQNVANSLRQPLGQARVMLKASSFSIGVAFPWGISISFTWP